MLVLLLTIGVVSMGLEQVSHATVCTALDQCHDVGTPDPVTGICSNPNKADGSPCDDGNHDPCTLTDTCLSGVCVGGDPVDCSAPPDTCHTATGATCDTLSGLCSHPALATCSASAPTLYANPRYQGPVRGDPPGPNDPGEVLLLAGTDFHPTDTIVVYRINDAAMPPSPPATLPTTNTANEGVISPLSIGLNAIKILLPDVMTPGKSYALWAAYAGQSQYSNRVLINDARPMWVSPASVYSSADRPGLRRTLKVIGRNLQPEPGQVTQVRLTPPGGTPLTLTAVNDPGKHVQHYAAKVTLPEGSSLPLVSNQATTYTVELSRDGVSWTSVPGGLTVLPDPPARTPENSFYPGDYRDDDIACDPCDTSADEGYDDTLCITRAIYDASRYAADNHTTANVVFGQQTCPNEKPEKWILASCGSTTLQLTDHYFGMNPSPTYYTCVAYHGIHVPNNVNLVGLSTERPTIETHQGFDQPALDYHLAQGVLPAAPCDYPDPGMRRQHVFIAEGNNVIQGLHFRSTYKASSRTSTPSHVFCLDMPGTEGIFLNSDHVSIVGNFFDDFSGAIHSYPGQVKRFSDIVIAENQFGCFENAVDVDWLEDSVIASNFFWPGGAVAPIAMGTRAGRHMDVSANTIDGTVQTYSGSYVGFRAGMFFSTLSSQEDLLVAENQISCVGTRPEFDGEAIATDANGDNAPGFSSGEEVVASPSPSASQVSVRIAAAQGHTRADYVGRWLRVDYGPGLGQARKIVAAEDAGTAITLTVTPDFDVVPVAGLSRVIVGNQVWQAYFVDNDVDNTCSVSTACSPGCATGLACIAGQCMPANLAFHYYNAGLIGLASTSVDVAIESNHLINTAGVSLNPRYLDNPSFAPEQYPEYFIDVRGNAIEGVFGESSLPNNHGSGIEIYGRAGTQNAAGISVRNPDIPGFGISVSHNVLVGATLSNLGYSHGFSAGVALDLREPPYQSWSPLCLDTIVFANEIGGTSTGTPGTAAISNGTEFGIPSEPGRGMPSYPEGTLICDNTYSNFDSLYTDWPGHGQTSSLFVCQ